MRIIGGRWRSRVLVAPDGEQTRPLPDRVKEAVFSILGSSLETPGRLPPITVADVFAGCGSVGLEALSRGAACCYFLERSPPALAALRANLRSVDAGVAGHVLAVDAWDDGLGSVPEGQLVDLMMLDPPFCDSRDSCARGLVGCFLTGARGSGRTAADAIAVLHHEAKVRYDELDISGWDCVDHRRYGRHGLTFFRRSDGFASGERSERESCLG